MRSKNLHLSHQGCFHRGFQQVGLWRPLHLLPVKGLSHTSWRAWMSSTACFRNILLPNKIQFFATLVLIEVLQVLSYQMRMAVRNMLVQTDLAQALICTNLVWSVTMQKLNIMLLFPGYVQLSPIADRYCITEARMSLPDRQLQTASIWWGIIFADEERRSWKNLRLESQNYRQ